MRLTGRILLRRKIPRTCKRLEPSRLSIEYVRPISDYFEWLGLILAGLNYL